MKYFFWIAFAVFLAASIPHVAYFFASFEPSQGPEGVWWWAVSYAIAISIDVTLYLLSYTAFKRYRKYRTAKAVWQHWLLIVICTFFSWAVNWAYAKQFHSLTMLSSAESAAPWLTTLFPFMASSFPLLGIVYTMMAETISETEENPSLVSLTELLKQKQLPAAALREALTSGQKQTDTALISGAAKEQAPAQSTIQEEANKEEIKQEIAMAPPAQPITGQFVALDTENPEFSRFITNTAAKGGLENNSDKLQMALEALKVDPNMSDEALAEYLSLKRPASARFWRLKAIEILNAPEKEENDINEIKVPARNVWATTGALSNGSVAKR
jgi:hypothetical protein